MPYQGHGLSVALIVSAFVLQVFFFAPMHVAVHNFGEFPVPFFSFLAALLALSSVLGLLTYLVVRLLELYVVFLHLPDLLTQTVDFSLHLSQLV